MLNKKRLAILGTRGIPARYGGFETFADEISVRLVEQGMDVTVYCEQDTACEQPSEYKGVALEYVTVPKLGPLTTIFFDIACLIKARKSFDIVYMLGYGASLFCFIPRLWSTEVWINMDGIEWRRSKWSGWAKSWLKAMERCAMWTPNRIIADADGIKSHLEKNYRRLPPCTVIPYGAPVVEAVPDERLLDEWNLHAGEYYLVVCRLESDNHVLEIIQGYANADTAYPLIIIGDHTINTSYVRQLLIFSCQGVHFIGAVFDQQKLQALRVHCFAYFHGHSAGGTNPSLLEALGCGNAVIAHDNPFNREVAASAAIYFQHVAEIPELIQGMQEDRMAQDKRKQIAIGIIKQRYQWETIVNSYKRLMAEG